MPAKSRRGTNKSAVATARGSGKAGPVRRLIGRMVLAIVIVIVMPAVLLPVYSLINPPITTVMIAKRIAGASIIKTWRPIEAISPHLVRAVIVAEDARFCAHSGIDWRQVVGQTREAAPGDWVRILHAVLRRKARQEAAKEAATPVTTADLKEEVERFKHAAERLRIPEGGNYL